MMKSIILLFFLLLNSSFLLSQNIDKQNILYNNKWTPDYQRGWLEKDTFYLRTVESVKYDYLKTLEKNDIKVSKEDIDILINDKDFINVLIFDSTHYVEHKIRMFCPVGETIYSISKFDYSDGKVIIDYMTYPWNSEKKRYVNRYTVLSWSVDRIMLIKQE